MGNIAFSDITFQYDKNIEFWTKVYTFFPWKHKVIILFWKIKHILKVQGASLVIQWKPGPRISLTVQEIPVQSLVQKVSTCQGATKPMCHNNRAPGLEPQLRSPCAATPEAWEPRSCAPKRTHCNEKPAHSDGYFPPAAARKSPRAARKTPATKNKRSE